MITTLLMTLEGSAPEVSRCVNVDDSMDLGTLAQVIDAAFGFSGAATHLYTTGAGELRRVFTETPGARESDETELTVQGISELTYIYDPTANWNIHVEVLGYSQLDGPTPLLIDASGPDIVESANGPELMTKFREEARRVCAGLEPNMEVTPLLLSFMPVMSPERMLDRLTVADPVTVATRIGYVAEEVYFDQPGGPGSPIHGPALADEFEDFLDSRPELRAILHNDPNPDRNPTLIAAVAEFFEDRMGDTEEPDDLGDLGNLDDLGDNVIPLFAYGQPASVHPSELDSAGEALQGFVALFRDPVKLTSRGYLPTAVVRELLQMMGLPDVLARPREHSVASVSTARRFLTGAGLVKVEGGRLRTTERGESFLRSGAPMGEFSTELLLGFEAVYGRHAWRHWVFVLGHMYGIAPYAGWDRSMPEDYEAVFDFLRHIGVLAIANGELAVSRDGRLLLEAMLHIYGG